MSRALSDLIAFTTRQAAVAGNIRRARLDRAIREHEIPVHKIEGSSRTLILRRDLEAFIEKFPPPAPVADTAADNAPANTE